ncbi:MAG: hypothetical protein NVS9B15_06390 [Acidobacteriaceae bacterium]
MPVHRPLCFALIALTPTTLLADFQYQEKTQITGGAMVGMMKMAGALSSQARQATQPIISSVYVSGNQMARVNPQHTEIIDLDKQTITTIDHEKHTYTTMTFAQMKQAMEEAARKAREQQPTRSASDPAASDTDMTFDVKVHNTGASKSVAGLQTNESIMNLMLIATDKKSGQSGTFGMTNDMWLAPEIPGYSEVRDFNVRLAKKMGTVFGANFNPQLFAMQPGMGKGMSQMVSEMSKLKGIPVLQIMRVGTSANGQPLPAASEAPLPPTPAMPSTQDVAGTVADQAVADTQQTAVNTVAGKMGTFGNIASGLGGFGGFGRKKKQQQQQESANANPAASSSGANAAPQSAVLMESTTESSGFSQSRVDPSKFTVPAGYQQVEARQVR